MNLYTIYELVADRTKKGVILQCGLANLHFLTISDLNPQLIRVNENNVSRMVPERHLSIHNAYDKIYEIYIRIRDDETEKYFVSMRKQLTEILKDYMHEEDVAFIAPESIGQRYEDLVIRNHSIADMRKMDRIMI